MSKLGWETRAVPCISLAYPQKARAAEKGRQFRGVKSRSSVALLPTRLRRPESPHVGPTRERMTNVNGSSSTFAEEKPFRCATRAKFNSPNGRVVLRPSFFEYFLQLANERLRFFARIGNLIPSRVHSSSTARSYLHVCAGRERFP